MRIVVLHLLVCCWSGLLAQKEIIETATQLILDKKYDEANRYLDSVLKSDKKNVDALMMKGNVLLNKEWAEGQSIEISTNDDEDVYSSSVGSMGSTPKIISQQTTKEIAALWKQCLKIDNTRTDIHKGLCTLYAMALMKDELIKQLAALIKVEKGDDESAYALAEYARKLKERGRFNDAMEVYKFIASKFPSLAGIRCDIASEYFYNGQLNIALQWLDSALNKPVIDETTYLNASFIYSELAYFDDAQKALDRYSQQYGTKMGDFYRGLRLFSEMDKQYASILKNFVEAVDSNAYYDEVQLSNILLQFTNSFTIENYRQLAGSKLPEYYRVFIYQRGLKQFADSCETHIDYGAFNNLIKNYSAAVQFLEEGERCNMDENDTDFWRMQYGYAFYMTGQNEKALQVFQPLMNSANAYRKHTALYFTAKIFIKQKRTEEAMHLLNSIVNSGENTKYVALAQNALNSIR